MPESHFHSRISTDPIGAAARLAASIAARTATCGVVGLGFVGTMAMQALIRAGFEVYGYDRSPEAVDRSRAQVSESAVAGSTWSVGTEVAGLARADIILIAVRVLPEPDGHINTEPLRAAAQALRSHLRPQRLILLESTVSPGTTRVFARDWLGAPATAPPTFIAHCPERLQAGNANWTITTIPRLVGGLDAHATELAKRFYQTICEAVVTVSAPEISELSKLLENVYMAVGIGLIGEVTRMAHALGVSAQDVTAAAATKPFGYHAFHPGPGIGGHCIPNDLKILQSTGQSLGLPMTFLAETAKTASDLPVIVVDYLERLMASHGWSLHNTRVLLVGMGFKIGSADTTATPARDVVRMLRQRGALPVFLDSRIPSFEVDGQAVEAIHAQDLHPGAFRAGMVLAGDPAVTGKTLHHAVSVLLDTGGGRIHPGGLSDAYRL